MRMMIGAKMMIMMMRLGLSTFSCLHSKVVRPLCIGLTLIFLLLHVSRGLCQLFIDDHNGDDGHHCNDDVHCYELKCDFVNSFDDHDGFDDCEFVTMMIITMMGRPL